MWYILFVVYAPYAMLPLPLRWCVLAGYGTALTHMVMAGISLLQSSTYVRRHVVNSGISIQSLPNWRDLFNPLSDRFTFRIRTLLNYLDDK